MDVEQLRGLPPLDGISEEGLLRVAACAAEFTREAGQVLALPDDPGSGMYMIREGEDPKDVVSGESVDLGGGFFVKKKILVEDGLGARESVLTLRSCRNPARASSRRTAARVTTTTSSTGSRRASS